MGSLRFVPAEDAWTVMASWPTIVTVPAALAEASVDDIWAAMSAPDATIESVVSRIPLRGASAVTSFSVVRFELAEGSQPDAADPPRQWTATSVVRGTAAVDLLSDGGSRRFGSGGAQPWALAEFDAVIGVVTGELPPVPESTLRLPAGARRLDRGIARARRVLWAADAADLRSEHAARPAADLDDTVLTARATGFDSPGQEAGHAAITRADAPAITPAYLWSLGPSREETPLRTALVIGRNPRPRVGVPVEEQMLVQVDSPSQQVSSNHVEIAPSGRTVVVTDLRSTNGTVVRRTGLPPLRLRQGDSVVVSASAIVEIGDGNVIHISLQDRGIPGSTL